MPIDASIISQAQNIPQIRYQPESQFESFAKIQPTLNAMRQMRQEQMQTQQSMAEQQALQEIRQRGYDPEEIGTLLQMHGKTQAQMELGVKMVNAARAARADQRPSVVGPGSALISHEGKELYRAPVDQKPQQMPADIATMREMGINPQNMEDVKRFYAAKQPQLATAEARLELDRRRLALDDLRMRQAQTKNEAENARLQAQIKQQERRLDLEQRRFDRESDPDYQARISAAKAFATEAAKNDATFAQQAPSALQGGEQTLALLNRMVGDPKARGSASQPHPGFTGVVGATVTPGMRFVQGSSEADFDAMLEQVLGGAFLEAYERLKGTGQITEIEGQKATQAITRMQRSVSESEFLQAAKEFRQALENAMERTRNRLQGVTERTSAPARETQTPSGASSRGAVGGQQSFPAPPQQAVEALLRGAGTDAQFDEIFGPGAAARARGR